MIESDFGGRFLNNNCETCLSVSIGKKVNSPNPTPRRCTPCSSFLGHRRKVKHFVGGSWLDLATVGVSQRETSRAPPGGKCRNCTEIFGLSIDAVQFISEFSAKVQLSMSHAALHKE